MRVNKTDAPRRLLQMAVQPPALVAIAVEIVIVGIGVYPKQKGVLLRIRPETKLPVIAKAGLRVSMAVVEHGDMSVQDSTVFLIGAEGIDNIVELRLEIIRFFSSFSSSHPDRNPVPLLPKSARR